MDNPYEYMKPHTKKIMPYSEFCDYVNEKELKNSSKTQQLKRLGGYMDISTSYGKITINKVYNLSWLNKDMNDFENIKFYMKHSSIVGDKRFAQFNIHHTNALRGGVYKIQLDNKVYIGQTQCMLNRFNAHWQGKSPRDKDTNKLLHDGATFEVLKYIGDKAKRCEVEKFYIEKYTQYEKYIILNCRQPILKHIIHITDISIEEVDFIKHTLDDKNIKYKIESKILMEDIK